MNAVIVKLYFCVKTNSCNKVFENVTSDILQVSCSYFFTSSLVNFQPQAKCLFLELKAAKYQLVLMMSGIANGSLVCLITGCVISFLSSPIYFFHLQTN